MVTKDDLLVNGRSVGKVAEVASMPGDQMIIPLLRDALKAQADIVLRQTSEEAVKDREVTIMGDKGTPFSVLKRVMATATSADYGKVSLAVIQREREVGGA
jgi:biopolymer transport protein ExbD